MFDGALAYFTIARDVLLGPVSFFRRITITEGIRRATYFALIIYFIRSLLFFLLSLHQGYFIDPRFQAIAPVSVSAFIVLSLIPFMFLLILYSQSIFLYRIANFFGGVGNLEAAYKILAFVLFLSIFQIIPYVNIVVHIYAIILLIIGVREVFNVDWISSTLALFFSFIFTAFLYVLFLFIPLYLVHIIQIPL
ncbi:MAG: YIP1 family protein [bacterium]